MADPPACAPTCGSPGSPARAAQTAAQASDFAKANPSAVVVRLPHAGHFIRKSNPDDVARAMNDFLAKPPPSNAR